MIGDAKGVWKTRAVHGKHCSECWDRKTIDWVRHLPWRTCDDDPNADGEVPEAVKLETLAGRRFEEVVQDESSVPSEQK